MLYRPTNFYSTIVKPYYTNERQDVQEPNELEEDNDLDEGSKLEGRLQPIVEQPVP